MEIQETLSRDDPIGLWIDDFAKSKDPRFVGKSKRERRNMAIAAYYGYTNRTEQTNLSGEIMKENELFENEDLVVISKLEESGTIPEELVEFLDEVGLEKNTYTVRYVKEGVEHKSRESAYSASFVAEKYSGVEVLDITQKGKSVMETVQPIEESHSQMDINEVSSNLISKVRQKAHQKSLDHYASAVSHDKDIKFNHVRQRYEDNPDHPDNNKEAAKHMKLHQKYSNMYFKNASKEDSARKREQSKYVNPNKKPFDNKSMGDHIQKTHYNSDNRSKYIGDSVELGKEFKSFEQFFKESVEQSQE